MEQRNSGFDVSGMSTASKILLIGGILFIVDLFLPWNRTCILSFCGSANGFSGIGILNFLLALVIVVMEVLLLAKVNVQMGTPSQMMQIEAYVAFGLLLFTIIKILVDLTAIYLFAFVGLILALVVAYGGYMRWQESKLAPPAPPPPGGGGFTA
ncbi:MAG: hypothetical protein M3O88_08900 [Actinomycetota bacterium]|jgi:hypothetical protein|nr:hypothetical protein [Actinomycetota bacterium]